MRAPQIYCFQIGFNMSALCHGRQPAVNHKPPDWRNRYGDTGMLRTIMLGTCVQVQGLFERQLENGKILVRVGDRLFEGLPVEKKAA